jgi:hypothetical protein
VYRPERREPGRRGNIDTESLIFEGESSDTEGSAYLGETIDKEQSDDEYRPKGRGSGKRGTGSRGVARRGASNAGSLALGRESSHTESSTSIGTYTDDERSDDEYQPGNQGKRPAVSPPPSGGRAMSKRKRRANVTSGRGTAETPVSWSSPSPEHDP